MGLAEKGGVVSGGRERARKAPVARGGVEVDAVVVNPVGARQQPGEYGCARRLADDAWGDRGGEACALCREPVEMGRLDAAAFDSEAVAALLVG